MYDVAASLTQPLDDARARLHAAQADVARAAAGSGSRRGADRAMASVAGEAIFTEALLAAQRARFEELKSVAK